MLRYLPKLFIFVQNTKGSDLWNNGHWLLMNSSFIYCLFSNTEDFLPDSGMGSEKLFISSKSLKNLDILSMDIFK